MPNNYATNYATSNLIKRVYHIISDSDVPLCVSEIRMVSITGSKYPQIKDAVNFLLYFNLIEEKSINGAKKYRVKR